MKQGLIILVAAGALLPALALGEDYGAQTLALCEKVKACAMEQMNEQDLTPEMRQMMEPMVANMCANVGSHVQDVPTDHSLYQPAMECLESLNRLDCQTLLTMQGSPTAECKAYEQAVGSAANE